LWSLEAWPLQKVGKVGTETQGHLKLNPNSAPNVLALAPLITSPFDQLGQFANSPGNMGYTVTQNSLFLP